VSDIEVIEEIEWDPKPILQPGVDYHDGITYFTVPLWRNLLVPSKKKGADPQHIKTLCTYVVTSNREGIWYDKDGLDPHGFVPNDQYIQDADNRWSRPSVKAFLDGTAEGPPTKELYDEIRAVYVKYVEFADEAYYDIMTLYVMYTYVFRLLESTGYIHFNGTAASGKSRNLSILKALAFNTIWASSMSAAALFRKLAGSPGTTCVDESEGFDGERGEELRRILNAGYKDGSIVTRAEKGPNDRWASLTYNTFGPKALASINALEPVIQSRSLIVAMRPAIRELPDFQNKDLQWTTLRDKLYLWTMENMDALASLVDHWMDDGKKKRLAPKLIGRQWEISAQYIILADYIGGETFATTIIEFLNSYFAKQQETADAVDRIRTTLRCLPRVLATKAAHPGHMYSTKDIHEVVSSYMESDATEYFKTKHVTKNLAVLGFRHTKRAAGGLQIQLEEEAVRNEFTQRRVDPFEEDFDWLVRNRSYQFETPEPEHPVQQIVPYWETDSAENQPGQDEHGAVGD
jgi:hypothetical protein